MFISIKGRVALMEQYIQYINTNLDMLEGKLDNPNNYSVDYIVDKTEELLDMLVQTMELLDKQSDNEKLCKKMRNKVSEVEDRFFFLEV